MHQISAAVWNRIAESEDLKTEFARRLFPLPENKLDRALEAESKRLAAEGVEDPAVRQAYLEVAPLLWEREAIGAFVADNPDLAAALPNLEDVGEAVILASRDRPMNARQQKQLTELLQDEPA